MITCAQWGQITVTMGTRNVKFLTFVYLRICFSGAFLSFSYFYFIFIFLEFSFEILKMLPLPAALSFCIWCNIYVRKFTIISSFVHELGMYYM